MINLMFDRHDPRGAPVTYYKSSEGKILDGLWCTPGIEVHRCGYQEPCHITGNHSLLWADISYTSALGHNPPYPQKPNTCCLRLRDSKATKRYLDKYESLVSEKKLAQRQFQLEQSTTYGQPLTPAQRIEADAIDTLRTRCMLQAERRCRKLKMGHMEFSKAISDPLKCIDFWDCAIKRRRKLKVSSRLWHRKWKAAKIDYPIRTLSLQDLINKEKEAVKDYRAAKKKHEEHRLSFLDTLAPKDRKRLKEHESPT